MGIVRLLFVWALVLAASPLHADAEDHAPEFMAAGVPRYIGESATDSELFGELASAGFGAFLPVFQYQEIPESGSLDRAEDFFPPCTADQGPFPIMREQGIGFVVPGQLLWQPGQPAEIGDDYLRAIVACTGAEHIAAVLSVDEPALHDTDVAATEAVTRTIYERAKAILPDVPVMMIHAPLVTEVYENDTWRPATEDDFATYLADVIRYSTWADVIGFDFYGIPAETAKLGAPEYGLEVVDFATGIPAYLDWLGESMPDKSRAMVLQGFGYADLAGIATDETTRHPVRQELLGMVCLSWFGGAETIVWWGQSHLTEDDAQLWEDIVDVASRVSVNAGEACADFG